MSERVKQASEYCRKHHQEHLIEYMKPVYSAGSDRLAKQILRTDLRLASALYRELVENPDGGGQQTEKDCLEPILCEDKRALPASRIALWTETGLLAIRRQEVAMVTMAGGQGTRLGWKGPKGTFVLPTEPPKSLFEIQCGQLMELHTQTGVYIPWLIMTSEENHEATKSYFERNGYFGYDSSRIRFFAQEMLPLLDYNGRVLVGKDGLATGPNGNGGVFSSLERSGNLSWLREQGIRKVFVCGIDNALVKAADPLFIGFAVQSAAPVACKSSLKRSFDEKAGIFCRRNGKPAYLEYTEVPEADAKALDKNGCFVFGDIGIVMYVFDMEILDRIAKTPLPYHVARKKTESMLPDGTVVAPDRENSIKFETFIFDCFQQAEDIAVLRVPREEEFAPIKNKDGEDSPASALAMYNALHGRSPDPSQKAAD